MRGRMSYKCESAEIVYPTKLLQYRAMSRTVVPRRKGSRNAKENPCAEHYRHWALDPEQETLQSISRARCVSEAVENVPNL